MTDILPEQYGHTIDIRPLRSGGRADVTVGNANETPASFTSTDIVGQLRSFFDKLEAEAEQHKHDPVAMVNALARMEALLADVRYVTGVIRDHTANSLTDAKIRRLTVEGVATMEAASASDRTDWQDTKLMTDMVEQRFGTLVAADSGVMYEPDAIAAEMLQWFRVQWRLTPIRANGLDPDNYSTLPTDEDGKPIKTPTVSVNDNSLRKQQVA